MSHKCSLPNYLLNFLNFFLRSFSKIKIKIIRANYKKLSQETKYIDLINKFKKIKPFYKENILDIIGYAYFQLGEYKKAARYLTLSLNNIYDPLYTYYFLALCYLELDKSEKSILFFLRCLNLKNSNINKVLNKLLPILNEKPPNEQNVYLEKIYKSIESKNEKIEKYLPKIYFYTNNDAELKKLNNKDFKLGKITSVKELFKTNSIKYKKLGSPEKLFFIDIYGKEKEKIIKTAEPYIGEIPNAVIRGGSSLVFFKNKIICDFLSDKRYGKFCDMQYDNTVIAQREDALLTKDIKPEKFLKKGIMLNGSATIAYGHWCAEYLPKLRIFEKHPLYKDFPLIVDENMPESHFDFLNALSNNPLYKIKVGETIKVNNLLIAPADTFFPTHIKKNNIPEEHRSSLSIGAIRFISSKIDDYYEKSNNLPYEYIYLARRKNKWRRLVNEEKIIIKLKNLGFKIIEPENLSFKEQVKIFRNAKFIVAPNGSSLYNLIFSNPKIKVLIIGQKNLFNWGGWFGSFKYLGYEFHYLVGKVIGSKNSKHNDYEINITSLISKIKQIIKIINV